jgi:RNA polymerase sigma-70 factor, ECF subfamily
VLRAKLLQMTMPGVPWTDVAGQLAPYIARRVPPCDVDDVIQDVLLRMHRGLGALRDDDRLTGWMFQIARSAIAERGRDRMRHPLAAESTQEPAAVVDDTESGAAHALSNCLMIFVARLPSPYREAITLVELEGATVRAAADMVAISVSGMKSRVQRGRAQLRHMFEECCEIAVDARGGVTDFTPRPTACCPSPGAQSRAGDLPTATGVVADDDAS